MLGVFVLHRDLESAYSNFSLKESIYTDAGGDCRLCSRGWVCRLHTWCLHRGFESAYSKLRKVRAREVKVKVTRRS